MKIRQVGAELCLADNRTEEQTDGHAEANSRISRFCERS